MGTIDGNINTSVKSGGARRDRTADLLHAMQALSQLSYGPTWRRGTLPERGHFVKKMNDLRTPEGLCACQPGKRLGFAQNGQGGVDRRGHSTPAYGQPNGLCQLAKGDAPGPRDGADDVVNGNCGPVVQVLEGDRCLSQ